MPLAARVVSGQWRDKQETWSLSPNKGIRVSSKSSHGRRARRRIVPQVLLGSTLVMGALGMTGAVFLNSNSGLALTDQTKVVDAATISQSAKVAPNSAVPASGELLIEMVSAKKGSVSSPMLYTLSQFHSMGVVNWNGYKFTYYSQRVLPGGGLRIPGRHVNENGYVCDGDGFIVMANDAPKGTVIPTPFGAPGKVYDRGTVGNHFDIYVQ